PRVEPQAVDANPLRALLPTFLLDHSEKRCLALSPGSVDPDHEPAVPCSCQNRVGDALRKPASPEQVRASWAPRRAGRIGRGLSSFRRLCYPRSRRSARGRGTTPPFLFPPKGR